MMLFGSTLKLIALLLTILLIKVVSLHLENKQVKTLLSYWRHLLKSGLFVFLDYFKLFIKIIFNIKQYVTYFYQIYLNFFIKHPKVFKSTADIWILDETVNVFIALIFACDWQLLTVFIIKTLGFLMILKS